MTIQEFNQTIEPILAECRSLLNTKGADYSGKEDRFLNFKANAERLGMTKYQVWSIYFAKHVDAVFNAIKYNPEAPRTNSEPLETRIQDLICYLLLLNGMLEEDTLTNSLSDFEIVLQDTDRKLDRLEQYLPRETPLPVPEDQHPV